MEKFKNIIVLDGEEYINQTEAAKAVGLAVFTFKKKVEKHFIPNRKLNSGSVIYKVKDIEVAKKKGWFLKWFM